MINAKASINEVTDVRRLTPVLLIVGLMAVIAIVYAPISGNAALFAALFPSPTNWALFAVALYLSSLPDRAIVRFVCFFWSFWFLLGNLNIVGEYYLSRLMGSLHVDSANTLYLSAVIAFILGCLAAQHGPNLIRGPKPIDRKPVARFHLDRLASLPQHSALALCSFPVLFLAGMYASLGHLPLLSGRAFVDEMYHYDYGFFYDYKIFLLPGLILLSLKIKQPVLNRRNFPYFILIAAVLFVSAADGKRDIALPFALAIASIAGLRTGRTVTNQGIMSTLGAFAVLSSIVILVRGGMLQNTFSPYKFLTLVADEYKDYVFTFDYYSRDTVNGYGYDWLSSTIGSVVNGNILLLFGYDKLALIDHDSARTWMRIFNSEFGIRTGIVSELWYAYGYFMYFGMFIFGIVMYLVAAALERCRTELSFITVLSIFSILATAIASQSTFTFGALVPVLYCAAGLWALNKAFQKSHAANPLRRY